jgi:hypothetical protein
MVYGVGGLSDFSRETLALRQIVGDISEQT